MRRSFVTAALSLSLALSLGGLALPVVAQPASSDRDNVTAVAEDDPQMTAAIANAQATLPEFLAMLENPAAGTANIGFKYPLGGWEHIWVGAVRRDGDYLTGQLSNVPMQEKWARGDAVRVPLSEVSDWAFMGNDGVMRGHYTTAVLLDRIDPRQAAAIRESFGW